MRQALQIRALRSFIGVAAMLLAVSPALAGGGSIQLNPAQNIQGAINSGQFSEIILEPGVYNQTIVIDAADAPLTIRSMDPSNETTVDTTILDGQFLGTSVILCTAGVGNDVVIDGLTIRNGEAVGASGPANRGGAIDCEQASPMIRRCVFLSNHADFGGGAFYVNAGNLAIEDCVFDSNNNAQYGGAAYSNNSTVNFVRCWFVGNEASVEGGACRLVGGTYTFESCAFVDNDSVNLGGAISVRTGAMLSAWQCWFESNFSGDGGANGRGGAIYHDGSDNSWVENSVFWNNECSMFGGTVYTLQTITFRNTTHIGETANGGNSSLADVAGASSRINFYNGIVWNQANNAIGGAGMRDVQYSVFQGGWPGTGNIGADSGDEPSFADAGNGNFRLVPGSAGIDAGDATKVLGQYPVDYDGLSRALDDPDTADSGVAVVGISVDMGAYEFQPAGGGPDLCPADTNGDGVVNVTDLLNLLAAWGSCF